MSRVATEDDDDDDDELQEEMQDEQAASPATVAPADVATTTRLTTTTANTRILGRNVNGTVVQTSMPQNEAELQLYRVMQRASLLTYYDTLLEMGGDDVQQLCDAGEEEFLEIMALVGMASKPLHVRRLQKALQEWLTNPGMFQTPVLAPPPSSSSSSSSTSSSTAATTTTTTTTTIATGATKKSATPTTAFPGIVVGSFSPVINAPTSSIGSQSAIAAKLAAAASSPTSSQIQQPAAVLSQFSGCCPVQRTKSLSPLPYAPAAGCLPSQAHQPEQSCSAASALPSSLPPLSRSPGIIQSGNYESSSCGSQGTTTPSPSNSNCGINVGPQSPTAAGGILQMSTPILLESQVQRLAELAEKIAAKYRPVNPKPPSGIKKKISKNLEMVMAMTDSDPRKMEEIRKYAAIYGRFDCKRKPEKPLTLHEVSVNEAAAQICRFAPILLTRRDELFPLARQVVRDSGHYFTKSLMHTSSITSPRRMSLSRENGDGYLSGGDESSMMSGELAKKRKLETRCTSEDDSSSVAGNGDNHSSDQVETARLRCIDFSRGASMMAVDSDGLSIQVHRNRHRKRQRRRNRPMKIGHKSTSSPIWQSCSDSAGNIVLDGAVEGLEDSNGCYSSFEDDWDDCNDNGCEDNFQIDSDDDNDDGDDDDDNEVATTATPLIRDSRIHAHMEEDEASCMTDKENDFNLKVIASCGDNIIAVANPALMNRNQPSAINKEQTIKEEIALRDRKD